MNFHKLVLLCALFAVVTFAAAPASATQALPGNAAALPADAPSRDQVMTLMDLLQIRRSMQQMLTGMKDALKANLLQAMKRDVRDPSQRQIDKINAVVDAAFEDLKLDDFIDATVPIYQRHLSKVDIEEMIRFYTSPTGQKLLREQPQMLQESMHAAQAVQQAKMDSLMDKIDRKMKELSDDDGPTTKQPVKK
jgi:hypothetical protein